MASIKRWYFFCLKVPEIEAFEVLRVKSTGEIALHFSRSFAPRIGFLDQAP
jgi:hypothetical protein